jgi:hypothetical protein
LVLLSSCHLLSICWWIMLAWGPKKHHFDTVYRVSMEPEFRLEGRTSPMMMGLASLE